MTKPAIIAVGKLHDRVIERLEDHFEMLRPASLDDVSPNDASRVEGAAVSGGFNAAAFQRFPNLKILSSFGVGYDAIDVKTAAEKGVVVTNTPDVLNDEVADTAIGLLLNTIRELPRAEAWLRDGHWKPGASYPLTRFSLKGRHVGLFGLGRIGEEIAARLEPFKVKISYHTRHRKDGVAYDYYASLKALAEAVDTLIAIVPKTEQTHKVINAEILSALGKDGILINVGRGWSVDEDALVAALGAGQLGAAGLDVFYNEPEVPQALLSMSNVVLLPHVASASMPTRRAMADLVADNLISWFKNGKAITPVPETPQR
ncbi:2-hydroxyacid dehydrogenase [Oryzifoliimicrobium ureilyticus]|uniref:2-hydroxyacid dehydrogenase n=1 Tax=Oryzifoliimicrobium ureilyticus TaxID=3113724 RepID=UPI0030762BB0